MDNSTNLDGSYRRRSHAGVMWPSGEYLKRISGDPIFLKFLLFDPGYLDARFFEIKNLKTIMKAKDPLIYIPFTHTEER